MHPFLLNLSLNNKYISMILLLVYKLLDEAKQDIKIYLDRVIVICRSEAEASNNCLIVHL